MDMINSESLVEALGYGAVAMAAPILFASNQAVLFRVVHHEASNVLVQLVEVSLK